MQAPPLTFTYAPVKGNQTKYALDFGVWFLGFIFIATGALLLTLRSPSDGDTKSDRTLLAVGWVCSGIGIIIYFIKVFLLFRGKLW